MKKPRALIFVDGFYLLDLLSNRFTPPGAARPKIRFHKLTKRLLNNERQAAAKKYFRYYNIKPHLGSFTDHYDKQRSSNILHFQAMLAKLSYIELALTLLTVNASYQRTYTWITMALDLLDMARNDQYDEVVLLANTEVLVPVVERIKGLQKKVHLFADSQAKYRLKSIADSYTLIDRKFINDICQ